MKIVNDNNGVKFLVQFWCKETKYDLCGTDERS
jgi:hypothetical protein